jgi:hypothetical protein
MTIALLLTIYPLHRHLAVGAQSALEQYWPGHPTLHIGQSTESSFPARLLADLGQVDSEFVVTMHEDFWLVGPVKQDLFDECLKTMQDDPQLVSCSLTWEPTDVGCYHSHKTPYARCNFQVLPASWNYTMNFQMRIWRRNLLMALLAKVPPGTSNSQLEPLMTNLWRRLLPKHRAITWAFPNPPRPSTFVDETDKSAWIIAYDNIIHAGQRLHFPAPTSVQCPIWINNRDRLTTTRNMVKKLLTIPGAQPIILDNASTYPPLLDWYATDPCEVIRLPDNRGPWAPWLSRPRLNLARGNSHYVVTDSDLDLSRVPPNVLDVLRDGLRRWPRHIKVGLSLEIDDLPPQFESTLFIKDWERQFWVKKMDYQFFEANTDTTFAMYRANFKWVGAHPSVRPALRADRPYTARHVPWYREDNNEERYYSEHTNLDWATYAGWTRPLAERPAYARHVAALEAKQHE